MRRVLTAALAAAAVALWLQPTHGLGRPGLTPVACPAQEWEIPDVTLDALPGAKAFAGRYDGGLYQIEIPATAGEAEQGADAGVTHPAD